jgi:predicted MFS family arabinose efflux permease
VLSEKRVMGVSVLLLGVGLVLSGRADTVSVLLVGTVVMSIGFHFFYPSNSSVVLMGVGKEDAPKLLGRLGSVSAIATVVAMVIVWVFVDGVQVGTLNIPGWGYRTLLYVTGGVVVLGSFFAMRNGRSEAYAGTRLKRKVIFRRQYWLYYVLTFLMGSRRHIFTTFAIFLLVEVHGISVRETAMLFLINNLINTYTATQLGALVARLGERKVLTLNFVGLIGVFLGYAFIPNLLILYGLFVLDNIFFGFNVAVDSYFQKIALTPEEITSNVSMAQTINHISALVVPVLGGILWEQVAPSATFVAGVFIAVISLGLVQLIRIRPVPAVLPLPAE